jgi:hypothetical protein
MANLANRVGGGAQLGGTRWVLRTSGLFLLVAGVVLYLLSEHTAADFAWTIKLPLTGASLGAVYLAASALALWAGGRGLWVEARMTFATIAVTVTLMLIATVINIGKFHTGAAPGVIWLIAYIGGEIALVAALPAQLRHRGPEPPRARPMSPPARAVIGVQAAIMLALGFALFILARGAQAVWPWVLTALTAQAIGSCLIGLGTAAVLVVLEGDWLRVRGATAAFALLGVLEGIALARYNGSVDFDGVGVWLYAAFLVSVVLVGVYGSWAATPPRGPSVRR